MEEIKRVNEEPEFREYMSVEEDNRKIENSIKAEWLEKGLEQGNKEASVKIAKEPLNRGMEIDEISKITELDI